MRERLALIALGASLLLAACGDEETPAPDLSDPRAVAENFTRLVADGDPAACELIGPDMVSELTATVPDQGCPEAVESGAAAEAIFFAATGEEIVAALPEAELDESGDAIFRGEGGQTLRVEPAEGVEFGVVVVPVPGENAWRVNGTTSGAVEVIRSGKDLQSLK